jgi:hypothetical protein
MASCLHSILLTAGLLAGQGEIVPSGCYLYQPAYCLDDMLRLPAEPYQPQPGDIVLSTDKLWYWNIGFILALAGHPHHSGIVFRKPDGTLGLLESGPHDTLYVEILDVLPHLKSYDEEGPVWVRRRRFPLTDEQSARLTEWALRQNKKRFALIRLGAQLTPLRSRGPLRTFVMAKPHGDRRSFFCSELLMESCVAAGLLDPKTTRPAATYPRDVFFDRSLNLYINKTLKLDPCWYPPARWTDCPVKP